MPIIIICTHHPNGYAVQTPSPREVRPSPGSVGAKRPRERGIPPALPG